MTARSESWPTRTGGSLRETYFVSAEKETLAAWIATIALPADRVLLVGRQGSYNERERWRSYLVEHPSVISDRDIATAEKSEDEGNRPTVTVELTAAAAERFATFTGQSIGKKLAIVLDGVVTTAPVVESAITGGRVQITMGGGDTWALEQEARDLVSLLRVQALPAPLQLVRTTEVPRFE